MKYKQDYCPPNKYFQCSDTVVAESEPKSIREAIPSKNLTIEASTYHSIKEPIIKSTKEKLQDLALPLDTSHYKKSSVRKITYRVIKK